MQNRRDDVIFNPRIGSFNLKTFLSFIQADGYEPLSVEGAVFTIKDEATCNWIAENAVGPADGHRAQREALSGILNRGPFRPGQLFELMSEQNIELLISRQQFMDMVASRAESTPMAVYETGFWADHWTYYLDMIESYLSIFPDTEERFLFDTNLPYFFSPASVQPRSKKYVLTLAFDGTHKHVQQLYATVKDKTKRGYMDQFFSNYTGWYELVAHWQHDQNKNVFKSPAISKLFLLAALKFSTRDAYGVGIEYEGGRPGWDDANNGLAGMLGSGMPETFALKSLLDYLLLAVRKYRRPITIPVELSELVYSIGASLERLDAFVDEFPCTTQVPSELFQYWDEVSAARENYRGKTKITFSGQVWTMNYNNLVETLQRWIAEVNRGIARAASLGTVGVGDDGTSGIMPTYFAYNVTSWELSGDQNKDGHPLVHPKGMIVRRFPLFLEGPTRMMKTVDSGSARAIYQRVRASDLHDVALSMYTLSANLTGQPISIGRTMAFPSGWLENQSIWLHMSYKFYLELLRQGLFDDFFSEISSGGLLPFMDPGTYGRSIITCSSFIASSAFADPSMRGRGFLPRLSGSTAEFLSMWVLMFIGSKPFFVDGSTRELRMQLIPSLPAWFFDTQGEDGLETIPRVSFKLFSSIQVHYYNERKIDLFGVVAIRYRIWLRDGLNFEIAGASIPSDLADKIRRVVFVEMIEVYF